jgi:hypothetical protein
MAAKKQPKSRIFPTIAAAAAAMAVPLPDLKAAKNAGCPAFRSNGNVGEAELRAWLKKRPKPTPPPAPAAIGKSGTNEALRRLEEAEAYAHAQFIGARDAKQPDTALIEERQRQWISLAKELRTFSAAMDGGSDPLDSIPRPEVVEAVRTLLVWQRAAFSDVLHNVVPNLQGVTSAREAAAIFEQPARESLALAMQLAQRSGRVPAWLAEAAMSNPDARPDLDAAAFAGIVAKVELSKAEAAAADSILQKLKP